MPELFDDWTDIYEAMIDWPKRLAHEGPLYRRLFDGVGARSVLDVACGTGRHAALFHSWGMRVEGADISSSMVRRARAAFGDPAGLVWAVRGFHEPPPPREPFDVAICVGNSLALAPDREVAERGVRQMLASVRRGGTVVVHVLNLWHLPDGPCVWQQLRRAELPSGEVLIAKGVHRAGLRGYVDLLVVPLAAPSEARNDSVPFLGFEAEELQEMALRAGAARVQLHGGYPFQAYQRESSVDLIMIAEK